MTVKSNYYSFFYYLIYIKIVVYNNIFFSIGFDQCSWRTQHFLESEINFYEAIQYKEHDHYVSDLGAVSYRDAGEGICLFVFTFIQQSSIYNIIKLIPLQNL